MLLSNGTHIVYQPFPHLQVLNVDYTKSSIRIRQIKLISASGLEFRNNKPKKSYPIYDEDKIEEIICPNFVAQSCTRNPTSHDGKIKLL